MIRHPGSKFVGSTLVAIVTLSCAIAAYALQPAWEADKAFVAKVSQGGMYEVEASRVAEMNAVAQDVKDVAYSEVHDHTLVGAGLKRVSTEKGITFPSALNAEFQARLEKLRSTPPKQFDAAYITDMEAIHDKDEKLFAQEADDGSDTFKVFAHQTDRIVKRHIGSLHGLDK